MASTPKSIGDVLQIEIAVIGPRHFPIATAKLHSNIVGDLPEIIRKAQVMQPELSAEDVIRCIWRTGCDKIARGLHSGTHPKAPPVQPVPDLPEHRLAARPNGD